MTEPRLRRGRRERGPDGLTPRDSPSTTPREGQPRQSPRDSEVSKDWSSMPQDYSNGNGNGYSSGPYSNGENGQHYHYANGKKDGEVFDIDSPNNTHYVDIDRTDGALGLPAASNGFAPHEETRISHNSQGSQGSHGSNVMDELAKLAAMIQTVERRIISAGLPTANFNNALEQKVDQLNLSLESSRSEMVKLAAQTVGIKNCIMEVATKLDGIPSPDSLTKVLAAFPSRMEVLGGNGSNYEGKVTHEVCIQTEEGGGLGEGGLKPSSFRDLDEEQAAALNDGGGFNLGLKDLPSKGIGMFSGGLAALMGDEDEDEKRGQGEKGGDGDEAPEKFRSKYRKSGDGDDIMAITTTMGVQRAKKSVAKTKHTKDDEDWKKLDCLSKIGESSAFKVICASAVLINVLLVGAETNMRIGHVLGMTICAEGIGPPPGPLNDTGFVVGEWMVLVWMVLEFGINVWTSGGLFKHEMGWNLFDLVILAVTIMQMLIASLNASVLRVMRVSRMLKFIRLMRLAKVMKVLRVVKFLHGVRKMIVSMIGSMVSLFWALCLMFFIMFIVSVLLMQGIEIHFDDKVAALQEQGALVNCLGPKYPWNGTVAETENMPIFEVEYSDSISVQVNKLYGSLDISMITLFGAVSGGSEWASVADPVKRINVGFLIVWCLFICVMMFGVLNILTGIFVDAAMQAAQNDRTTIIQQEVADQESATNTLRKAFMKCDTDGSGTLTEEEFEDMLEDEEVCAMLAHLGLHASEAAGLFKLLDDDHSGRIGCEEFVTGCIRLKGGAREVDIVTLMYQNRRLSNCVTSLLDICEESQGKIEGVEKMMLSLQSAKLSPTAPTLRAGKTTMLRAASSLPPQTGLAMTQDDELVGSV